MIKNYKMNVIQVFGESFRKVVSNETSESSREITRRLYPKLMPKKKVMPISNFPHVKKENVFWFKYKACDRYTFGQPVDYFWGNDLNSHRLVNFIGVPR